MYDTYRIFTARPEFRAVAADTGSIGGTGSHEFQVIADSGEDDIALPDSDYAANVELAEALAAHRRAAPPRLRRSPRKFAPGRQDHRRCRRLPELPAKSATGQGHRRGQSTNNSATCRCSCAARRP